MPLDLAAFIGKHLAFKTAVDYRVEELEELLELAKQHFCRVRESAALVEVPIPVNIVGDIHGQFADLLRIFMAAGKPGPNRYLFLGDYVDRGPNSVECICLLLALKLSAPSKIFLLRGNHEFESVNRVYGFWDELERRFSIGLAMKLSKDFNQIFSHFPLAALVRGRVLCMHGGLSPMLHSLNDIRAIRLPLVEPEHGSLEEDLLWADPSLGISGFEFNRLREVSVAFGADVVKKACKRMGLDFVIRAHQMMPDGFGFFANRKLITVFSAPRYAAELNNKGAVLKIDKKMVITYVIINPVEPGLSGAEGFKKSFNQESVMSNMSKAL